MKLLYAISVLLVSAAGLAQAADPSQSSGLIEGGFARAQENFAPLPLSLNAPRTSASVFSEIGFTPRHRPFAGGFDEPAVSFRMDIDTAYGGGLDFNPPGTRGKRPQSKNDTLLVGGAIELEEVGLLGGIGRTSLFGEQTDMLIAGMTLGGLQAKFGVGETAQPVEGVREVLMLSTDLRITPWISVQGDLAVSEENEERENLAVGRVGIRLQF